MKWILAIIIIGLCIWAGWFASSWMIEQLKGTGGLVFAREIIQYRIMGVLIGLFIGAIISFFFINQFE